MAESVGGGEQRRRRVRKWISEVEKLTECVDACASLSDMCERREEKVEVKRKRERGKSEVTLNFASF